MAACSLVFPVIIGLVTSCFETSILHSLKESPLARNFPMTRLVSLKEKIIILEDLMNAFNVHWDTLSPAEKLTSDVIFPLKTGIMIGGGL